MAFAFRPDHGAGDDGGRVLYCGGTVFAILARNTLYLKADTASRPRFEALKLQAFQPFPDRPGTMCYYAPPAEFFEDADAMLEWGRAAVTAGMAARKKPRARRAGARRR